MEIRKYINVDDYQNIRNFPNPGQIMFNDIKYNDLVVVDGFYIPYICTQFSIHFVTIVMAGIGIDIVKGINKDSKINLNSENE